MKKLIYTLVILAFVSSVSAQWVSIKPVNISGLNVGDMHDIYFIDANTGFAAGEGSGKGVILKTINGGANWTLSYLTTIDLNWIRAIHFVNATTGFACGKGGFVYSTTNAGQYWSVQQLGCTTLVDIKFINANTGLTCGDADNPNRGPIYKTTNSGANWIKVNNSNAHMDNIQYIDANTIYASGDYVVYKSTDGGNSWTDIYPENHDCNAVCFLNTNTGFVCGNYTMIKTTNAGANWTDFLVSPSDTNYHSSVYFTDNNTGYVSLITVPNYFGRVYKTTNAGANWHFQQTLSGYADKIKFINAATGFACGGGDIIWKTINGGGSIGIQNISTEIPAKYSLSQNYPNPFNPTTKIRFAVQNDKLTTNNVQLIVYDAMGREVQTLVNESLKPGTYEASFDGSQLTSGVYFYKLTAGDFSETKKMLMLK